MQKSRGRQTRFNEIMFSLISLRRGEGGVNWHNPRFKFMGSTGSVCVDAGRVGGFGRRNPWLMRWPPSPHVPDGAVLMRDRRFCLHLTGDGRDKPSHVRTTTTTMEITKSVGLEEPINSNESMRLRWLARSV